MELNKMPFFGRIYELIFINKQFGPGEVIALFIALSVIMISIVIFYENQRPEKTIAWLLILFVFPLLGFILYLIFGHKFRKIKKYKKKKLLSIKEFKTVFERERINFVEPLEYIEKNIPDKKKLITLLHNMEDSQLSYRNSTEIFTDGKNTFDDFVAEINKAESHIHMEFYIFRDDETGKRIQRHLIKKAQEGIEVRIIYDGMGNIQISKDFINEFTKNGIQAICFSPVIFPIINNRINYRNHRKILVIDGKIAYIGGFNIGKEYEGNYEGIKVWRDTHLKISGEGAKHLQNVFIDDWYYLTNESLKNEKYFPVIYHSEESEKAVMQIVKGGPDSEWESIMQMYFAMVSTARKNIFITTPYFVPNESLLMAITNAALSGIDVRILIPGKSDYVIMTLASSSYIKELLEAGVRVFEYDKESFVHAKTIVIDGEVSSVGTANLDVRSFSMNFEINAFIYNKKLAQELEKAFYCDLESAKEITLEDIERKKIPRILLESWAKLFSPLL
ncbi:MAG: cardiolipin synthase [Clostridia bacterium]|nr:cardiolipin synthase [Clostridia bacterium]